MIRALQILGGAALWVLGLCVLGWVFDVFGGHHRKDKR